MKKLKITIKPNKNVILFLLLACGLAWSIFNIWSAAPDPGHLWVDIGDNLNDALTVARGGTGATTLTANGVALGNTTGALLLRAPGTTGNVLASNGTTWASSALNGLVTLLYSDETDSSVLTNSTTETILKFWVMNIDPALYRFYIWEAEVKAEVGNVNANVGFVWNFKLNNGTGANLMKNIFQRQLGSTIADVANGMKTVTTISATSTNSLGASANLVLTGDPGTAGVTYNMTAQSFRIYGVK